MKLENNSKGYLQYLWRSNKITQEQYFFRLKAEELEIKTYKPNTQIMIKKLRHYTDIYKESKSSLNYNDWLREYKLNQIKNNGNKLFKSDNGYSN